uniref:Transcriptional activator RfaH n=1 Tax=Desulfatirhabdium butyrativorans TaxID=340467 RepID=A0A7C4RSJ3_9BACT
MMLKWFVIRTKTNREMHARLQYERQQYEVYLPLIKKVVRHARSKAEVLRPFFPGYLFLRLDPETCDWISICSTFDAIGPIRFGDRYVPVPDWVIDDLKARETDGVICLRPVSPEWLVPGAAVGIRIDEGVVAPGIVYSNRGKDNVEVLLQLLGREVKTKVSVDRLQPPETDFTQPDR